MSVKPIGWVLAGLLPLAAAGPATAQNQQQQSSGIEIGVRGWRSDLSFDIQANSNYIPGTSFDASTIGFSGSKLIPVPYARLGGLGHYLIMDYLQATYDGSTILRADLTVSGTTFPAGTDIDSSLDLNLISGYYNYALTDPDGSFQVGVLAGVKYIRLRGKVDGVGNSASVSLTAPTPVLGSMARLTLFEGLEITAQVDGLQLPESILGMRAYVLEALAEVTLNLGYFSVGIGYQYMKSDFLANKGDDDEIEVGLTMKGMYAVVALVF